MNQKVYIGMLSVLLAGSISLYGQSDSTSAIRLLNKSTMQKADGDLQQYLHRIDLRATEPEVQKRGKFTILINSLSNGQYEIQVYRMVAFGSKRVMSTFSSLYQSGIEYSYSYDSQSQQIRQYHFICPPNSLTCWSDPSNYAMFQEFDWQEKFPAKTCSMSVFTSEEYGREYLQASC